MSAPALPKARAELARYMAGRQNASDELDRAICTVLEGIFDGQPVLSEGVMLAARRYGLSVAAERLGRHRVKRLELLAEVAEAPPA